MFYKIDDSKNKMHGQLFKIHGKLFKIDVSIIQNNCGNYSE